MPDIERGNRTLEERFRVQYYHLPFEALPTVMIQYLPLQITRNRSMFPKKEGISKYFSPHVLLGKRQVDFKKEYEFSFGDYVQAYVNLDPKNSQLPRSIDAVYLRPLDLLQSSHQWTCRPVG